MISCKTLKTLFMLSILISGIVSDGTTSNTSASNSSSTSTNSPTTSSTSNTTATANNTQATPKCPSGCLTCSSTTNCTSCSSDTTLYKGQCIRKSKIISVCTSNCKLCTSPKNCQTCEDAYYLSNSNTYKVGNCFSCQASIPGCKTCLFDKWDYLYCDECEPGYLRNYWWDKCTKVESSNSCEILVTERNSVYCQKCKPGFYLKGNNCQACGESNCVDCSNNNKCSKCKPGTAISFSYGIYSCLPEAKVPCSISNCKNCDKTEFNHVCTECIPGFKINSYNDFCIDNSKCGTLCSDCKGNGLDYCAGCNTGSVKILPEFNDNISSKSLGKCLNQATCPTDEKFYEGNSKVYALFNSTCIPCPFRTTKCSFNGSLLVIDSCEDGYAPEIYISENYKFYYCKSCSPTPGCKVCDANKQCKECQADFIRNTNGLCENRYIENSTAYGFYIDKSSGKSIACPQAQAFRCSGPNPTNIISCIDEYSVFKGSTIACKKCSGNCRSCYWKGDSEICLSCNFKTLAKISGEGYECLSAIPDDHVVYIDSLSIFNYPNLYQPLGFTGSPDQIPAVFPDPITKKLWDIFNAINPVAGELCKYFFLSLKSGGVCFSDKDKTPLALMQNTFSYANKSTPVSLALGRCPYNCKKCPDQLLKYVKDGKSYCIKDCPTDLEPITDATTNITSCEIPKDKIIPYIVVHSYSPDPNNPNTQDFSVPINMTCVSINGIVISAAKWNLTSAYDLLNTTRTKAEMEAVIMKDVFTDRPNLQIPVANFQLYPYSLLTFTITVTDPKNHSVNLSQDISVSPASVIETFIIDPINGTSIETKFQANYKVKNEYVSKIKIVNGTVSSGVISCYPDKEITPAPTTTTNPPVTTTTTTSTTSTTIVSSLTQEPTSTNDPQTTQTLNDNVSYINSNVTTTSTTNTQTVEQQQDLAANVNSLNGNYTFNSVVNIVVSGSNGNIGFRLPLVTTAITIKCFLLFDFEGNLTAIKQHPKLSLYPTSKNTTEIIKIISSDNSTAIKSSDIDNTITLIQSMDPTKNNTSPTNTTVGSFVCPKSLNSNSLNSFCCPPDNLCSNHGACTVVDENGNPIITNSSTGLGQAASNSTADTSNASNINYQCVCETGFQGPSCQYSDADYNQFSLAMESVFIKFDQVAIDTTNDQTLTDHFTSLESLSKMDIQNYITISKLIERTNKYFPFCKGLPCLTKAIKIIDNLMVRIPNLPLRLFLNKIQKGNMTTEDINQAITLRKLLTLKNFKCYSDMMSTVSKVIPQNQTEVLLKVGSTSAFMKKGVKGMGLSSNCGNLGTSSSLSKNKCSFELPANFTAENVKGDNFYLLFSNIPRESMASVSGSTGLNSDITDVSLNNDQGEIVVKDSLTKHCYELSMINFIAPALMSCSWVDKTTNTVKNTGCDSPIKCTDNLDDPNCLKCCCNHMTPFVLSLQTYINNDAGNISFVICCIYGRP